MPAALAAAFFAFDLGHLLSLVIVKSHQADMKAWRDAQPLAAAAVMTLAAGTQLARIESLSAIASPGMLGSFALLGVLPLVAKKAIAMDQARKVHERFRQPARLDRNLVVIGGGSAGLVTVTIAAAVKARVTQVEMLPRILVREDPEVSELVTARFRAARPSSRAAAWRHSG